jgi:transcription-repair coupling factor (superfamily II helicase)
MITSLGVTPSKKKHTVGQLYGAGLALGLVESCTQDMNLIITADNLSAYQLCDELQFFQQGQSNPVEIIHFPDWETLPYDHFSPHQDIISQRLEALTKLMQLKKAIVICSISTAMHRLCPKSFIQAHSFNLNQGQELDLQTFKKNLIQSGYYFVNKVMEHGECAIRGSIIDVFPMGSHFPFRIDLFDEEIDSIRIFDPDNQRSLEKVQQINLLPAREFPLNESSITHFRRAFRNKFSGNPSHCPIYENISDGIIPSGIEYYLPLFFDETSSILDYLREDANIFLLESYAEQGEQFWNELKIRHEQLNYDITRPILTPQECFIPIEQLLEKVNQFKHLKIQHKQVAVSQHSSNFPANKAPKLYIDRKGSIPLANLSNYLNETNMRCLLIAESAGRREVLLDLLKEVNSYPKQYQSWQEFISDDSRLGITVGSLAYGVELIEAQISIIVESQIFGEHIISQRRSKHKTIDADVVIRDLAELRVGAPVVHIEHGIGRYQGLQQIQSGDFDNEFLVLEYAGGDKIYVPVTSLHLINRYTGGDLEQAPLHRLGSEQWSKAKRKAAEKINDVAIELLDVYAKRAARKGHTYEYDKLQYQQFAANFPFEETEDQKNSINAIISDMCSEKPMDRLICGDVGFGKTEVAMRAAFIAVLNNRQVCILVPTTLLAGQHFDNFRDRFADFPINIELLSRFKTAKETEQALSGLKNGKVDIIIGTHKLLQKGIDFKDLGLLIIDEEHRFGVKQKEYIKGLRTEIDILSLTATPIPRTLNMSMAGIRDISLIATPPAKRLAIKTFWQEKNQQIIREAILREILRGGQVYFLHNNVQTIARIVEDLRQLVPEAKINFAHGQMRERDLERIMSDFYHQRFNVLVCTTIIETGIDIPTANTILIDRADKFGLAQLHQLRGRVGRSHHQAYAYLLTPNVKAMTSDAVKRLEAIVSLEDLGAGFTLATHDLEIRGAGELLGEDQSGNMHAIGFSLYMELLEKAVDDLKSGKKPELEKPFHVGTEIDLKISAIIPDDYISDIHTRLIFYKRIANSESKESLHDLQVELVDRFGLLPQQVKNLIQVTNLKLKAKKLGIVKITANTKGGKIEFSESTNIDPSNLIKLIQLQPQTYQLSGPTHLKFTKETISSSERIQEVAILLDKISA